MKTLLISIAVLLSAAACKTISPVKQEVKCVVTKVSQVYRYPGTLPDYYWSMETDCGYYVTSNCEYRIGDTVSVEFLDFTAMSHKQIYN
jgi:hypothetical protein